MAFVETKNSTHCIHLILVFDCIILINYDYLYVSSIKSRNTNSSLIYSGVESFVQPNFERRSIIPACIYSFKVNNWNTRTMSEICTNLTIKISEWHHWCRFGVFIVNFLNRFQTLFYCLDCWLWKNKCQLRGEDSCLLIM